MDQAAKKDRWRFLLLTWQRYPMRTKMLFRREMQKPCSLGSPIQKKYLNTKAGRLERFRTMRHSRPDKDGLFWVCRICRSSRRSRDFVFAPCVKCKNRLPDVTRLSKDFTSDEPEPGNVEARDQYARVVAMQGSEVLRPAKELFRSYGLSERASWHAAYHHTTRPKLKDPPKGTWYTQVFPDDGYRYHGYLTEDLVVYGDIENMPNDLRSKQFQLRLPDDLHWWLKQYAAKNRITMTDVIIRYLQALRAREEGAMRVEEL